MNLVKVKCAFCGKDYFRQARRVNEAKKFGWNQYCSHECQNKARTTRIEKVCGNSNCNNVVSRALNQFKQSKSGLIFCSQSCAAIANNKKCLNGRVKIKPKLKTCAECGKQYKKSTNNLKYCSLSCRRKAEWYTPESLLDIIRNTAQKLKRVPARREIKNINDSCRKVFGSWNNAIKAAGFQPNRSHNQRMYKRVFTKALDGHICDSVSELLIDNWFIKNKIEHERNISYPDTNHKADWGINLKGKTIFVEYFGLAKDSPRYDRSITKKKTLCCKHKIKLIEVYPWDLYPKINLDDKLKIFSLNLSGR